MSTLFKKKRCAQLFSKLKILGYFKKGSPDDSVLNQTCKHSDKREIIHTCFFELRTRCSNGIKCFSSNIFVILWCQIFLDKQYTYFAAFYQQSSMKILHADFCVSINFLGWIVLFTKLLELFRNIHHVTYHFLNLFFFLLECIRRNPTNIMGLTKRR